GRAYWLAVLGKGGTLNTRTTHGASCRSVTERKAPINALPRSWTPGASSRDCVSAYVSGVQTLPPSNTSRPTISGTARQGQQLAEAHGGWANSPSSYGYQWLRCDTSGLRCLPIAGAVDQHYLLAPSDVEHTIEVQETAGNLGGTSSPAMSA